MIDPITGWFEIMQYNNEREIYITNLIETTCMVIMGGGVLHAGTECVVIYRLC